MFAPPKSMPKAPQVKRVSVKAWTEGTVTAYDDGRTPQQGLRSSGNVLLDQDGTVRPRPSLVRFGPQPAGTVQGSIFEFRDTSNPSAITNWMINLQKITQNEVQTLTITGTPTGGTFTLTFGGQTTAAIAFNAAASAVQTALRALSTIGSTGVTCTGGALPGSAVVITFGGTLANTDAALITATSSLTGGTSPAITLTETTKGGYTTYVHTAKAEDTSWTKITGKTYSTTAPGRFCQVGNQVLVMNGTDSLSYYDIVSQTVIPFVALSTPSAPTVANSGGTDLTTATTSFKIYYAITANSTVGETTGSSATSLAINTDRDNWNPTTQALKITWSAVTNAKSYNVYMGQTTDGAGTPVLYPIATGIDPSVLTFVDNGSRPQDISRPIPTHDSTAGPKVSRGTIINGRPWLVGDADKPFYVWYGGDPGHELDFSPANGGGFTQVGNGTKELPSQVMPFRDGRGNAQITVLCQGTNGRGKRYLLTADSVTFGSTTLSFYDVTEDNGQDGTDSPDGVILYNDSLWYPSRDGFKTTGTKPQLQNILSTDRVSNTIQDSVKSLNTAAMDGCVGLGFEGRLYWAVPLGTDSNSQIWVLDLERKGAWMKPWDISADWMVLVSDNSSVTHFVVLSNNSIYELAYTALTSDNNVPFATSGSSGQITFSADGREWGRLRQVVFVFLRPQGQINVSVSGKTEDEELTLVGDQSFNPVTTSAGWSEAKRGWSTPGSGWSRIKAVPTGSNPATQEVTVEVDEDLQWFTYSWSSAGAGVDYNLSDVIAEYVNIGVKDF